MNGHGNKLEIFEVGPFCCGNEYDDAYDMGYMIGKKFSDKIRSRLACDHIFQYQLLPFGQSPLSESLITSLTLNNQKRYPRYWDELKGTADGSGVPFLHLMLINFRKEILPFIPKTAGCRNADTSDDCSDVLVVSDTLAIAAHNEDANVALLGHTYLIKGNQINGVSFVAYTYAGELPSCAFGFNSHGLAFTLNSVPPTEDQIEAGGIGRNFISRDLLEAKSIHDALNRIRSSSVSVGHSYNLIDSVACKMLNVETASRKRFSVLEVGAKPFFHANMYQHLQVQQVQDENSMSRKRRAAVIPTKSKDDILSLLGDADDPKYPIYMTGPILYTLCTAVIDLREQTLSIIEGNPKKEESYYVFSMSLKDFRKDSPTS